MIDFAAHILPNRRRPRHATDHLADATDESSRSPDHLETATDGPERSPHELENATGHLSRLPGRLSRHLRELENAPTRPERVPSDVEGSGAARRRGIVARREGVDRARRPRADARECGSRALDRAGDLRAFSGEVPEGRHAPLASAHPLSGGSGVRRGD
jgi:hypothetical protein